MRAAAALIALYAIFAADPANARCLLGIFGSCHQHHFHPHHRQIHKRIKIIKRIIIVRKTVTHTRPAVHHKRAIEQEPAPHHQDNLILPPLK